MIFRLRAPHAQSVSVALSGRRERITATRDDKGVWSAQVGPLDPEVYAYSFVVDGVAMPDPFNPLIGSGQTLGTSLIDVPGSPAALVQDQPVPHGSLHIQRYDSHALGWNKTLYVYTPPGYEGGATAYPIWVLRHGAGGGAQSMATEGRLPEIMDNLIAQGRAKPMLVVMPDGYATKPVGAGSYEDRNSTAAFAKLGAELKEDILPLVERSYRTLRGPENRAISGFSMGAGQAFLIGLRSPDLFAWVGEFSSGVVSLPNFHLNDELPGFLQHPEAANRQLKLLWLSVGSEDPRRSGQLQLADQLKKAGIRFKYSEAPGGHELKVQNRNLADFACLLFK